MNATKQVSLGAALVAVMFGGCGTNHDPASDGVGNALISVSTEALTAADVATVTVAVSGAHISPDIVRALDGSPTAGWSGTITDIPAGSDRKFAAEALDAARVALYSGSTRGVTIANGKTAMVSIFLQQVAKPDPFVNTVPRITSLVISDETIAPGQTITLTVTAVDPDLGDTLSYAWTGRDGTLGTPNAATTTWTAPSTDGVYELVASATDRAGAKATVKAKLDVREYHGSGSALVNATLNTWPVVVGLVPTPTRINAGETTKLELTASDPDGDPLTYAWTASCGTDPRSLTIPVVYGTFDDASAEDPSFMLNSLPPSGQCTLTTTISDGRGGTNTAKVTIETGSGIGDTSNCTDSLRNGTETDVDCGGPSCPGCADGRLCAAASDCLSGVCTNGICVACVNVVTETFELTETQVTDGAEAEMSPVLGEDATSEILVFAQTRRLANGSIQGSIVAQRLNPDGTLQGPAIQVSGGTTHDMYPDIYGSRIVYTAFESPTSNVGLVMLFDLATMTTTALPPEAVPLREARIHGDLVVWVQGEPPATQVMYYDLNWGTSFSAVRLGGPSPAATELSIGSRLVGWSYTYTPGGQRDIMKYDLHYGAAMVVNADPSADERVPNTDGNWMVWEAASATGMTIEAQLADVEVSTTIVNNGANVYAPTIHDGMVAYDSDLAGNSDIYLYRMSDSTSYPVTKNPADQYQNNLRKNKIAYVDTRNTTADVFVSTFAFVPHNSCPTP